MLDFLLITLVILLVTRWFQMKPFFWRNSGLPYTVPVPIFGSSFPMFFKPLKKAWTDIYTNVGDNSAYGFHFFDKPSLLLGDPNLVKRFAVTDADSFTSHGFNTDESYDPLSKGLFFANGQEWKDFRAKMTPYFTPARIKSMMPLINPIANDYVNYLAKHGKVGPVDVHAASIKFTVDVVMSTVFGVEPDSFKNPNSFFYGLQRELISFTFGLKSLIGVLSPALYRMMGLTIFSKNTTTKMGNLMSDLIDQRLNGVGNRPDFAQGMVDLMKKEEAKNDHEVKYNSDGTTVARFDRFSVTGHCMLMYAAGTETTGNTMSFLLYELARHQDIQDIARKEIVDMLHRTNDNYSYDDLHSLHYVHLVIKETLRKYPVIVSYARKCTRQTDFDGFTIPVGTMVILSPICLHYDTRYFSEPNKFIPERFADESSIMPGSYVPFGMGPRTCIGMKFAETEIALSLCKLLPKHRVTCSSKTDVPIRFSNCPTLSPKAGIWLNIEEI